MTSEVKAFQERQAMYDINELMIWTRREGVRLLLIGGYAARAFSGPTRYTHDVDMVVHGDDVQRMGIVLKKLGYARSKIRLGNGHTALKGIKRCTDLNQKTRFNVEMHISVGEIYDASSGMAYYPRLSFEELPEMDVMGFFRENRKFKLQARVLKPEELLITKLIIERIRDKDLVDAIAIMKYGDENPERFSSDLFAELVKDAGLAGQIADMISYNYLLGFTNGDLDDAFKEYYGRGLDYLELRIVRNFIGDVLPQLR